MNGGNWEDPWLKISMSSNFKFFINCIGCTQNAFNRITDKIHDWEKVL